jgi:hypothetical protein
MNEREFLSIIFSVKRELVSDANIYHRQYIQVLIIPVAFTLAGFIGIAVTSAGISLYGEVLWDPLRWVRVCIQMSWLWPHSASLIDKWDNRVAAFFASFSFVLGTIGTNVRVHFFLLAFVIFTKLVCEYSRYQRTPFQQVMTCRHSARVISISGAGRLYVHLSADGRFALGKYWQSVYHLSLFFRATVSSSWFRAALVLSYFLFVEW